MSFKGLYIRESISIANMQKAIGLIKSVLEKNTGFKFFEGGEEEYSNSYGTFLGIRYFLGSTTRSVRFNWQASGGSTEIVSIDVWDDSPNKKAPTITIETKGISLAQAIPQLANLIKSPKVGEFQVGGPIQEASMEIDGQVFKSGKDAAMYLASQGNTPEQIAAKTGLSALSAKDYAYKYLRSVKGSAETPIPNAKEKKATAVFAAKKYADPDTVFEDLKDLVALVVNKVRYSLLLTGMPGIGKTYSVTDHLNKMGKRKGDGYVVFKGTASPFGLYRALYDNKDSIVVFDDCDSVLKDDTACNILKAALDSYPIREISWKSKSTFSTKDMSEEDIQLKVDEGEKYPDQFPFRGQVIFISNVHKSKMEPAVLSRSMCIDITLTMQDVFKRMQSIIKDIEPDVPLKLKQEVLDFLRDEYKSDNDANIRTFLNAIAYRQGGSPNWKRLVSEYA